MRLNKDTNILAKRLSDAFRQFDQKHALLLAGNHLSYKEFGDKAHKVSNAIKHAVAAEEQYIAILGHKSPFTYAGILGALFASKAYMPLNLKFPASRTIKMLERSNTRTIVAGKGAEKILHELLSSISFSLNVIIDEENTKWEEAYEQHTFINAEAFDSTELPLTAQANDIAYLLFTSGTTGNPKGVAVSNSNVCAYLDHLLAKWEFSSKDRFSHTFDLTFDLSVHDMMVCWLSGACLCLPSDDNPLKMGRYIKENDISVWFSVPSVAVLMAKMRLLKENAYPGIRLSFFCGEPLTVNIADKWKLATAANPLINLYGPSEATIAISEYPWDEQNKKEANGIVSIGKLFPGQDHVLLEAGSDKHCEQKGELCLGGTQVISEYLNDKELSSRYFIELPDHPGKTWYRTGDLVYKDDDEDLFFMGRIDAEVKIAGFRVNLLEVDGLVRKLSGIEMVASILDERSSQRIICFVGSGSKMTDKEIIGRCREELPWYMIPEVIIFVEEMPLNANGKIDRNELKKRLDG